MIRAPKLRVGYFAQHQIEALRPTDSALPLARRLPMVPRKASAPTSALRPSPRKKPIYPPPSCPAAEGRLTLALITREAPHILMLDEPTNHLDIDAAKP